MTYEISQTNLKDLLLIKPKVHHDDRGYFSESFNKNEFERLSLPYNFVQDNQALSAKIFTIRGLHYQKHPKTQSKLIRVLRGEIFDVAVDIRKESSTFKQWQGFHLSADNKLQILIPKGFAHGICTLTSNTEVLYKVDEYYSPEHDAGIIWNDPDLKIKWPIEYEPSLSDRDKNLPTLDSLLESNSLF